MTVKLPRPGDDLDDAETWADVHVCDSRDADHQREPRLATRRLFWVNGPVEYCAPCAAKMRQVAAALGTHVHEEPIAPPPVLPARRAIALQRTP